MPSPRPAQASFLRATGLLIALLSALFAPACNSYEPPPKYTVYFFLEAPPGSGTPFTMPYTKLEFRRQPQPFMDFSDVKSVQGGRVNVLGVSTPCIFFQFDVLGKNPLFIQSTSNIGKRIFLFVDADKPMGARLIDGPIDGGMLFIIPDMDLNDTKAFNELVADLQESQKRLEAIKNHRSI